MKRFKRLLSMVSVILCMSMLFSFGGTVSAAYEYRCTGDVYEVKSSTSSNGNVTQKIYCWHTTGPLTKETHLCYIDLYNSKGVWQSSTYYCYYGGGLTEIDAASLNNTRAYITYCSGEFYEETTSTNWITGTVTYKTYRWHSQRDGILIKPRIGTHLCVSSKYDKNGKWISDSEHCPYDGGFGEARIIN